MDLASKKTALRMIPYGLYVLTGETRNGWAGAGTVNWVTQASFEPPLVVVGLRADSAIHGIIKDAAAFCLNILGKGQEAVARSFFKPAERDGNTIGGQPFRAGQTGSPVLENAIAFLDCRVVDTIEKGDHSVVVGEVVDAGVTREPSGRPDDATLWLKDLGENMFYGG